MRLKYAGRVFLYGFLVWVIPFVIAILIFPLRQSYRPLFESIMPVAIAAVVAPLSVSYLRRLDSDFTQAGIFAGLIWLAISLALDLVMFIQGPMKMSLLDYLMDIGVTYLMIPIMTISAGALRAGEKPAAGA